MRRRRRRNPSAGKIAAIAAGGYVLAGLAFVLAFPKTGAVGVVAWPLLALTAASGGMK